MRKRKKYKEIWLIAERYDEARDNGYHLFTYIRETYPSLQVFYVIDKHAIDKSRIQKYNKNILDFGSFKHYLYYMLSKKLISTHVHGTAPDSKIFSLFHFLIPIPKKSIFLQHGITQHFLPQLSAEKLHLDLFVCGAKPEYEFVKNHFGYTHDKVKYIGFPRFDHLERVSNHKQILLMPTFRMWLYTEKHKLNNQEDFNFINSNYYKTFQALINQSQIIDLLEKFKLQIIFYPHYEIQKYLSLFSTTTKNITIASKKNYEVQELLKNASLLITDYSSVHFDFAYMQKPILYYQFDYDKYLKEHYQLGYFSFEKNGFGPIVKNKDQLYYELRKVINNSFRTDSIYFDRMKDFFELRDTKNTKRNFEAIYHL